MARQRDSKLIGTASNLIFYNFRGLYCMRTKPASVRRTESSVLSGLNFGKASKICKQIRNLVAPVNPVKSDQRIMYRLTGALNKFIAWKEKMDAASARMPKKLPYIYGFQFNDQADLNSIIAIRPSIKSKNLELIEINLSEFIPSQSLQAPASTESILLKIILMGVSLDKAETGLLGKAELEIPYSGEAFQPPLISVTASSKPGDLLLMVMSVQYLVNKNGVVELLNDKKKMPCGVVWTGFILQN